MGQELSIHTLVSGKQSIPTLPEVVMRIQDLAGDPESGPNDVGKVVAEDAALAAKVLRVANSAFYGLQGRCTSTEQATTVLGIRMLLNIVLQVSVIEAFDHLQKRWGEGVSEIWTHATRVARMSSFLAGRPTLKSKVSVTECYACGLLHDIGKLVMLDRIGSKYMEVLQTSLADGRESHKAEHEAFGFDHAEVGGVLASRWGLPDVMVRAIQRHHGPEEDSHDDPVLAVVVASNLAIERTVRADDSGAPILDEGVVKALALTQADVDEITKHAAELCGEPDDGSWHEDPW